MAIFTVNNNDDSGLGSLRQAIEDANLAAGLDTIEFTNNLSGQTITLISGELQITDDLTVNGLGADLLTVSGNNASRVFLIEDEDSNNRIDVTLNGLTITEGASDGVGGILNSSENLTILNSNISNNAGFAISGGTITVDNSHISDNGAGISSTGTIEVTNSTISGNTGSAIVNNFGIIKLTDSTISNNGDGISGYRSGLEIDDSKISDNEGAGIDIFRASATISNSKITSNKGGGIVSTDQAFSASLSNTIVAGNFDNSLPYSERQPDISVFVTSNGYNFIGDISGIVGINPFTEPGDLFGTNDNPLDLSQLIEGTPDDDSLAGTANRERLEVGNGNDTLRGRGGIDVLLGQADHDSLLGGTGDDTLNGGAGNDILLGQADNDFLVGEDGNDTLNGNNGADQLFGNADDDRLVGANGDDTLDGGIGADQLLGQADNDLLLGGEGNDTLNGGTGADQLFGEAGNDRLVGGDGHDTLNGGTGLDTLIGGAESDRFFLIPGVTGHHDIIRDYQDSLDRLVLTGGLSFNDLTINQSGTNTRILETATNQTLVILNGINASQITHHDFEFGAGINGIRVEAEDYVNYFDTTVGNTGGAYRHDDVDLEVTSDLGGGYNVGYITEGEWLTYNVNLPASGLYQVVARVASATEDGRIHHLDVSLDDQSTNLDFNATGGWQSWTDVVGDKLNLTAGSQELRLDMGSSGFNLNYIDFIPLVRVEAEDYKEYSDSTPGNIGGAYRNDDVDIEVTTDIGGGFNVGWIDQGESLTYDVEIPQDGLYQIVARVASASNQTHRLSASINGEFTNLNFNATGGWQSWTDVSGGNLNLSAGSQELRLDMGSSGFNINYINFIPVTDLSNIVNDDSFAVSAAVIPEIVEIF